MSKADELSRMMGQTKPAAFTPRQSVAVKPIPEPKDTASKAAQGDVVPLFAKIPREDKRWLDHYRVDSEKELGEIVTEAVQLLRKQVEQDR